MYWYCFLGLILVLTLAHIIPNLLNLLYVYVLFNRHHQQNWTYPSPRVGVFVPCKGVFPGLAENLEAIARQQYKNFTVTYISESNEDLANEAIESVVHRYRHCRHVISGSAVSCGQKNYNLLKGLTKNSKSEVFVFCDADIRPSPKCLSILVSSLFKENISVATGFVWITPPRQTLAGTIHSMMGAFQATFISNNSMKMIWGGTMAIRSCTFKQLRVVEEWSRTAADDMVLSRLVRNAKLNTICDPRCLVISNQAISSVREVITWFTRQILFLKFYARPLWLTALAIYIPSSVIMMAAGPLAMAGLFYSSVRFIGFICIGFSLIVMFMHTLMKFTYRDGQSTLRWFLISPLAQWIATYSLVKTVFRQEIRWAGRIYKLDRKGRVIKIHKNHQVLI